jgi:hypothetical protein
MPVVNVVGRAEDIRDGDLSGGIKWFVDGVEVHQGQSGQLDIPLGTHQIKAEVTDSDGATVFEVISISVNNAPPQIWIDAPIDGAVIEG